MNGKTKMIWLAILLVFTMTLSARSAAAKGFIENDFSKTLGDLVIATDDIYQNVSLTLIKDEGGPIGGLPNGYANLKFMPLKATTGVWMGVSIINPLGGVETVHVQFQAKNTGSCVPLKYIGQTCVPMVYIGAEPPTSASQFKSLVDPPLDDTWQDYSYDNQVKTVENGKIYVAIGWHGGQAMVKTVGSVGFDNLSIVWHP